MATEKDEALRKLRDDLTAITERTALSVASQVLGAVKHVIADRDVWTKEDLMEVIEFVQNQLAKRMPKEPEE